MLKIQLFGKFRVWRDGEQIPDRVWERRLALQKLLQILLTDRRAFPDEELAEYLWEEPHKRTKETVRSRISELRHILEPKLKARATSRYILRRNSGYCFCWEQADYYWIDADEFDQHLKEAQRHYAQQAWANAAREYEAALALYQGDYLAEERYEEWAVGPSRLYVGREFEYSVLQRAWEGAGDCLAALEGLLRAHLVAECQGRYEFTREKIREVVHEGLSLPRRQLLHGRVMQALEHVYAGQLEAWARVLAGHAYQAQEWKKALEYSVQALKKAVKEYHHQEGLELAEMGLEAAQRLEGAGEDQEYINRWSFDVLYERARIFERQGRRGEQQQALQKLRELAKSINEKRKLAMVCDQESGFYWSISDFEKAERAAQEALVLCEEVGDQKGIANSLFRISNVCYSCDRYQEALRCEQKALAIRRQIGDQRGEANSLNSLGNIYHSLGQEDQALSFYRKALEIHQAIGDRLGEAAALTNIGNSRAHLGQYDEALRFRQQALEIFTEIGELRGQAISLDGIGNIYESQGKYEVALSYASRALAIHEQTGNRLRQAAALSMIGNIYYRLGQYVEALGSHQRSVDICVSLGHKAGEGRGLRCLSMIYTTLGQHEEALRWAQQALEIHQTIGDKRDRAGSLLYLSGVFNNLGHHKRALQCQQEAFEKRYWLSLGASIGFSRHKPELF